MRKPWTAPPHITITGYEPGYADTVYRLFDAEGTLLYVGCSVKPLYRLREHLRNQEWRDRIASMTMIRPAQRHLDVCHYERDAIKAERPLFNITSSFLGKADPRYGSLRRRRRERIAQGIKAGLNVPNGVSWRTALAATPNYVTK